MSQGVPFEMNAPWTEVLWPSLETLVFTGLLGDFGPLFSVQSISSLGSALPLLKKLHLQMIPSELNVARDFPVLESLSFDRGVWDRPPQTVHGSTTLRHLSVPVAYCSVVAAFVASSPFLVSLDLGRTTSMNSSALVQIPLPVTLKYLTTNGGACGLFSVVSPLEKLVVLNVYKNAAAAKVLTESAKAAEVRSVLPDGTVFGSHVAVFLISRYSERPPGFEPVRPVWGEFRPDPVPVDHSRVRVGALSKVLAS